MKKKSSNDQYCAYLPEEIIVKILTPLPAKSIGRCRCVSQRWRTLLSDPQFIQAHLNLPGRRRHIAVRLHKKNSVFEVDFQDAVASSTELKRFEMPKNLPPYDRIVFGSFYNGLILARGLLSNRLFLLNPTIQECKQLPTPPANYIGDAPGFLMLGIGYNKVVAVSYKYDVYVCSLESDNTSTSWKTLQIQNSPLDDSLFYENKHRNGVFLNGSIHWLVFIRSSPLSIPTILAFDLTEEKFRVVPTPLPRVYWHRYDLRVVDESLSVTCMEECFIDGTWYQRIEYWVMNEYGVESSWTKLQLPQCHRQPIDFCCKYPVYLGNEEFMSSFESSHPQC